MRRRNRLAALGAGAAAIIPLASAAPAHADNKRCLTSDRGSDIVICLLVRGSVTKAEISVTKCACQGKDFGRLLTRAFWYHERNTELRSASSYSYTFNLIDLESPLTGGRLSENICEGLKGNVFAGTDGVNVCQPWPAGGKICMEFNRYNSLGQVTDDRWRQNMLCIGVDGPTAKA